VSEPVEKRGCHFCVAEDLRPFTEAEVGRDHYAGALIEFAQKVEQQCAAGWAERQVAKLVEDDEVDLGEHLSHLFGGSVDPECRHRHDPSHYSPVTSSSSTICPATKAHL